MSPPAPKSGTLGMLQNRAGGWRPNGGLSISLGSRVWEREAGGRGLTDAGVWIGHGLERVPVEEGFAAVTVLPLGVVATVFTHAPAAAAAPHVHRHVEVTAVRVAVAVTS